MRLHVEEGFEVGSVLGLEFLHESLYRALYRSLSAASSFAARTRLYWNLAWASSCSSSAIQSLLGCSHSDDLTMSGRKNGIARHPSPCYIGRASAGHCSKPVNNPAGDCTVSCYLLGYRPYSFRCPADLRPVFAATSAEKNPILRQTPYGEPAGVRWVIHLLHTDTSSINPIVEIMATESSICYFNCRIGTESFRSLMI